METQEVKDQAGNLIDHTVEYLDTFFKVNMMKLTRRATSTVSAAITSLIICGLGFCIVLFGGFAAAWWLGDLMSSRVGGFLVVAGFFLLLTIILVLMRKKVVFPFIRNMLIRKIYD